MATLNKGSYKALSPKKALRCLHDLWSIRKRYIWVVSHSYAGDALLFITAETPLKLMQFGPIGWSELLLIIIIALLLFGPRKLPELARSMGEAINEFRKASSGAIEEEKEKKSKKSSEIRELALNLGIDVAGKTDEELMEEIKALAKKKDSEEG